MIIAGTGLLGSFVQAFGRARTPIDPCTPSQAIVTDGPYRLTRNPAYLSITVIDRGVIAREERYLDRKFGAIYLSYKRSVRRWL